MPREMPLNVSPRIPISIFLSSPGDVSVERELADGVIRDLDRVLGPRLGLAISSIRWEKMIPDMGLPQSIINSQHRDCDIFIGIMWARFGTPTVNFGSGTEEEFQIACERWRSAGTPRILFYFCNRELPFPRDEKTVEQLMQVVRFQQNLRGAALVGYFSTPAQLADLIWEHLFQVLCDWPGALKLGAAAPGSERAALPSLKEFDQKLDSLTWICYAPIDLDPDLGRYPNAATLRDDLEVLGRSPFGGIVTFGSENNLRLIPKLAKDCGLSGVIMGVYRPDDARELQAAIDCKDYVDGYCIGHLALNEFCDVNQLISALKYVRDRTGRPVTTTERIAEYLQNPRILDAVDWIFPDVHYYWHQGANPEDAADEFVHLASAAQQLHISGKRVLLKMVSFPSDGGPGLSQDNQTLFFRSVRAHIRNDATLSKRTRCAFFSAFDSPWKTTERGWSPAERSTGLYDAFRAPKPAVQSFLRESWNL